MQWQSTPYILLLFLAAVVSFLWAVYGAIGIQNRRRKPYVLSFVILCLAVTIWAALYAVQLASATLEAKLFAYKLLHVGGVLVPPAWLAFAMAYSGWSDRLTPATIVGLGAIPLALLLALPTNPHSLALAGATLATRGSLTVLVTENGPLYFLHLAYSYAAILTGACLIVAYAVRSEMRVRRQAALVVAGAMIPLVLNVFNVLEGPPFGDVGVNLTPVSLSLSTVLFGITIVRYRMLDLTPVVWNVVLAQMSDGVIVLDDREEVVSLNPAAERLLGRGDAVRGASVGSLLPEYDRLKRDGPFLVLLRGANDEERSIQLTRSPLTRDDETYGWVVLAQDVTVPERQRRQLEQQNARLDGFARVVSHDLRNPLTVISGRAELAERTGDREHFEVIGRTVRRMDTFLEELLLLSQQGETVEEFRPVSLAAVGETVGREIGDDRLRIDVETDATVLADENRLRQVLDNLFRNARDHNGGDVTVRLGALADGFYIEDDGVGIPTDERAYVFDVGFSTRSEGTGFGLAIIRDIVEAHGWIVAVTVGATGGARFEITDVDVVSEPIKYSNRST